VPSATEPPFSNKTRPVRILAQFDTPDGDRVSLRIPAPNDPCCCCCAVDPEVAVENEQLPCWWFENADCGVDGECSGCGMAQLCGLIGMLEPRDQLAALQAHLIATTQIQVHLDAFDASEDGEVGEVCVSCLTEPEAHRAELEGVSDVFCRDLLDAARACGAQLQIVAPAGPTASGGV
jgi:hypothetical protein